MCKVGKTLSGTVKRDEEGNPLFDDLLRITLVEMHCQLKAIPYEPAEYDQLIMDIKQDIQRF